MNMNIAGSDTTVQLKTGYAIPTSQVEVIMPKLYWLMAMAPTTLVELLYLCKEEVEHELSAIAKEQLLKTDLVRPDESICNNVREMVLSAVDMGDSIYWLRLS